MEAAAPTELELAGPGVVLKDRPTGTCISVGGQPLSHMTVYSGHLEEQARSTLTGRYEVEESPVSGDRVIEFCRIL
jgi:hypothetical protein